MRITQSTSRCRIPFVLLFCVPILTIPVRGQQQEILPVLGDHWQLNWISDGTEGTNVTFGYSSIQDIELHGETQSLYVLDRRETKV